MVRCIAQSLRSASDTIRSAKNTAEKTVNNRQWLKFSSGTSVCPVPLLEVNQINDAGKNLTKGAKDTVDKGRICEFSSMRNDFSLAAGDEIKNKSKQMKDSVADTANTAKDKLNEGAQNVKDGADKGQLTIRFLFTEVLSLFDVAAKSAKKTANDAADKVKDTAADIGTAVNDGQWKTIVDETCSLSSSSSSTL